VLGAAADDGGGGYTTAAGYSSLYYGAEAAPYALGQSSTIFSRLWLMRVLSALMMAFTAAFAFLFARELAPSISWFAPVAGLAVAFQPMLAFVGGSVNNDNLLFVAATLELYLLARALRRGLTGRLAVAIGAALGFGIVVKPTMYGLAPAALAVIAWIVLRSRDRTRSARVASLAFLGLAVTLTAGYFVFAGDKPVSETVDVTAADDRPFAPREFLSYTWQWYLPQLPFMEDFFSGSLPVYDVYFKGFWANFGHLDTRFPGVVYLLLLAACVAVIGLIGVTVYRARDRLVALLPYLALGAISLVSLAVLVNFRSYLALIQNGSEFAQGRYLLPAIAVVGAGLGAAALAFGRRHGIVAGTALVLALAFFNAFSLGLVLTRFYV
jgi:4-amino-4-deoxy-L-arabinose transferase-like glycosyltransferase